MSPWACEGGGAFQNRAEPWMAEPSVQGCIHSVFWKAPPPSQALLLNQKASPRPLKQFPLLSLRQKHRNLLMQRVTFAALLNKR